MAKPGPKAFRKAKKNPGGRPTKLTPEVQDEIVKHVRAGCYLETAAAVSDVDKQTLQTWLRTGKEKPGTIYGKFRVLVSKALAYAEARDLILIGKHGEKHWGAVAWRLERKFPQKYGRTDRLPEDDPNESSSRDFNLNYNLDDDKDEPA